MAPFIGQKIRPKCRGQRSGRTVRMGQPCCSYIYYVLPEEGQHRANFDSKFIYVCTAAISSTSVKWLHASMLLLYNRVNKLKEVLLLSFKGGVDALVDGYTPKTTKTINSNAGTHFHTSWVQHLHNCSHKTMYCSFYYVCCLFEYFDEPWSKTAAHSSTSMLHTIHVWYPHNFLWSVSFSCGLSSCCSFSLLLLLLLLLLLPLVFGWA